MRLRLTILAGCLTISCALIPRLIAPGAAATKAAGKVLLPEPIKVKTFAVKTEQPRPGRSISKNDAWLKHPLVQVENTSGKAIEYLALEVRFAEDQSFRAPFVLSYGQAPGRRSASESMGVLMPGSKVDVTVSQHACSGVRSHFLASCTPPLSGSRVTVRINGVVFADGTAWFDGLLHLPDVNDPLRWNVVGSESSGSAARIRAARASYSFGVRVSAHENGGCWDRIGTQWITCCDGFPVVASAILVQQFGGLWSPQVVTLLCPDGENTCEYIKQVGCF